MGLAHWVESCLDKVVPRIEVSSRSSRRFTEDTLRSLIDRLVAGHGLRRRSVSGKTYVLIVPGRTFGDLSQLAAMAGKAKPAMYANMKSRCQLTLLDDGTLKMSSFEHMAGLSKERDAFRHVLSDRLAALLDIVAQDKGTWLGAPASTLACHVPC